MLLQILKIAFRHFNKRNDSDNPITVVCATRLAAEEFWATAPMGISLSLLKTISPRIRCEIAFSNTEGLPEVYNRVIAAAKHTDILVFVHDDVWLDHKLFIAALDAGISRFAVLGVAGNTRVQQGQPGWAFKSIENGHFVWDWGYLSGAVWHGHMHHQPELTHYGPCPAHCELMDGVFLAARGRTLKRRKVKFDTRFDFHFYDLDFCRSARTSGLSLGTWDIPLTHESAGIFGGDGWTRNLALYREKWESPAAPKRRSRS